MSSRSQYTITMTLADSRGVRLYRAVRNVDRLPVVLKVLDPARGRAQDLECLKHEYEIGKILDSQGVVKPLALETHRGLPALVLEDSGGESLDHLLGAPMRLERFLRLALGITAAVADVHRQEIIHKDLKPQNILVNPANDEVKITDFGVASRLPREHRPAQPPRLIKGSLPYMSPEQTGRTNRALDSRTDLYSLGITFYEMLTGRLPFQASDPVEWVHCHVARAPPSPSEIVPEVPEMIARVVLKLLSKMPEDRYQSARGLRLDLERCLQQWGESGKIEPFAPGERDATDRIQIPQKLYGREAEIALLLQAFGRVVATGTPEILLVSGYSGVGKSALVQELCRPIVRERAFFLSGKFDQYKRDIPYATLIQAFRELVLEILAESAERIAAWRQRLLGALGINAQLIVEVIPQVELVIGRQPPAPDLPPAQAQNRFRLVLRRFVGVFAQKEHPLALFLDDLQWADSASLGLLQDLLVHSEVRHLLVIGAYRDNEVTPFHPLLRTLDEARKAGARISDIVLGPLSREHLTTFVSDTLRCCREDATPLSDLVYEKTAGNPFFAIQFLTALHEERLIELDERAGAWQWDVTRIRAKGFTDNVVDLMVEKLKRLPAATQEALKQAACLGNTVETPILAAVHGRSEPETHADLWEAVRGGLVLRLGDTYKFAHDRVQEAAYSRIPEGLRAAENLRIARLLLAHRSDEAIGEHVFDIASHFNRGSALLDSQDEKIRVAWLNLLAGRKAKAATAYVSALSYLSAGHALLSPDSWETHYDVTYGLYIERAQCEWLCGRFDVAAELLPPLMARARSRADKAAAYRFEIDLLTTRGEVEQSTLATLTACSQLFDLEFPLHPTREEVQRAATRVWQELGARTIEELIHLPTMTDPDVQGEVALLSASLPAIHPTDSNLHDAICCEIVSLSLRHGNTSGSPHGYVIFGATLGQMFEKWGEASRFGKLACGLVESPGHTGSKASTYVTIGVLIDYWVQHVRNVPRMLHKAFESGVEQGDINPACYAACMIVMCRIIMGDPLADVAVEAERYLEFTRRVKHDAAHATIVGMIRLIERLRGESPDASSQGAPDLDHLKTITDLTTARGFLHPGTYYTYETAAQLLYSNHEEAVAASIKAREFLTLSCAPEAECYYWTALALAAHHDHATPERQSEHRATLAAYQERFRVWQKHCPQNFFGRYALLSAEVARIEGRDLEAMRLYEDALRSARENGFVHNEAVAYETAARFYRTRGFDQFADMYLREARSCYVRWGADGKVQSLDRLHPELVERPFGGSTSTFVGTPEQLDLLSLVKALQSISSEIVLPKLAETLLQIMLQQAGGQRGALILVRGHELAVQAEATTDGKEIRVESLQGVPASADAFPISILHYVARTREPVILNDAAASARFASDPHLLRRRPRSLLCLPIVRRARVSELVYLENNLATGAFTEGTIHVLELLGAQAAISLDNATLYADLERSRMEIAAVLDNMVDSVFVVDRTGRTTLVNNAAVRLIGLASPAEALGPIVDLARRFRFNHPDGTPYAAREIPILRALGGETVRLDEGMISLPGAERTRSLHTSASPMRDEQGEVVGAVAVARDVTELVELDRLKDQFLRVAAHELKTPVTVVMGYAETLSRMAKDLAPSQRRMLDGLLRGAGRIDRIVADLLFLSQIQLGRLNLVVERVDLGALLDRVAARRRPAEQEPRVRVTHAEPVVLQGDRELLERVMAHLIDNALRYSPNGGEVEVSVRIAGAQDAIVSVRDHGVGIPAGKRAQIFECFYRAHTDTPHDYGGMGTGLYLSRAVVARHGGEMWFESEEGRGSTFHVRLPLTRDGEPVP